MSFKIGQKFESYELLKEFLNEYETNLDQKYWKRSSRTIQNCNLKKSFNKRIIYYEVHYSCIYSGGYKTRGKGLRKSSSQRMDCPAFVKLRADETGQFLEVKSVNENHQYHDYSVDYLEHLLQNKKLNKETKQDAPPCVVEPVESNKMSFKIGQKFESYEQLKEFLKEYETHFKQKYWKRSSRTLQSSNLRKDFNESIIYYEVHYSCIYSGRYRTKGKGLRKTSTQRMNCPAFIKLRADEMGQVLEVRSVNENHQNHENSVNYYEHLPQNRKLNKEAKKNAPTCPELGGNKEKEQQQMVDETVSRTLLNDLAKFQQGQRESDKGNLLTIIKIIEEKHAGKVSVLEHENSFQGMFFTTEYMRKNMSEWPEFVAVDGTYKLLKHGYTVYIFLIEDSNGDSRIVGMGILANEDQTTFTWLVQCFKNHNPSWTDAKCLITDKITGREVLKAEFLGIPTYLSLFYILKTFRRDLTVEKLNLCNETKEVSLQALLKLVYSFDEEEYNKLYEEFQTTISVFVVQYFNNKWHPIRNDWLPCLMVEYYKNNTNNRLETISNKIKQVVLKNSSFYEFIQSFFFWFESQEYERTHKIAKNILTVSPVKFPKYSTEAQYQNFLTSFGFEFLLKQFNLMNDVTFITELNDKTFLVKSSAGIIEVTNEKCNCADGRYMGLPCRHIFAVRQALNEELFSETLCSKRWTRSYYISLSPIPSSDEAEEAARNKNRCFSLFKKKKKIATELTNELTTLISYSSNDIYHNRISVLKNIIESWKNGTEVTVTRTIDQKNSENLDENTIEMTETESRNSDNSEYILPTISDENLSSADENNPNDNENGSIEMTEPPPHFETKVEAFELPICPMSYETQTYSLLDIGVSDSVDEPVEN